MFGCTFAQGFHVDEGSDRAAMLDVTRFDADGRERTMRGDVAEAVSLSRVALEVAGVIVGNPCGEIEIRDGRAIVGALIITPDSCVEAVPRWGIDRPRYLRLVAAAAHVWLHGRPDDPAWQFDAELGWVALVGVRQSPRPFRSPKSVPAGPLKPI